MDTIDTLEGIRAAVGTPSANAAAKIGTSLHPGMVDFIAQARMAFIASVGSDGFPTVSPRGDGAGFIRVKDERTLYLPERKGNKLAFTLQNILHNSKVSLIVIVPNTTETLRIAGVARLVNDPALNSAMASATQQALLAIEVTVEQCYFHCAKAFLRSGIWQHQSWDQPLNISLGAEIARQLNGPAGMADELDAGIRQRYQTDL